MEVKNKNIADVLWKLARTTRTCIKYIDEDNKQGAKEVMCGINVALNSIADLLEEDE